MCVSPLIPFQLEPPSAMWQPSIHRPAIPRCVVVCRLPWLCDLVLVTERLLLLASMDEIGFSGDP